MAALTVVEYGNDPAGRFLLGVLAAGLAGAAVYGGLVRPVVAGDETGLVVVDGLRRRRCPWPAVLGIRPVTAPRRRGVRARSLEVELTEDRLVLVPSYLLDAPADEVAARLNELRGSAPGSAT